MFREDVLGITLAELTLFLLFLVITAFYFQFLEKQEVSKPKQQESVEDYKKKFQIQQNNLDQLKFEIDELKKKLKKSESVDEYKAEIQKQRDALAQLKLERNELLKKISETESKANTYKKQLTNKELKSKQTPTCSELKLAPTYLEEIGVIGLNTFKIKGEVYSYPELLEHFSKELKFSKEHGCNHCVKFWFSENVTTDDYYASFNNLRKVFIVTPSGKK